MVGHRYSLGQVASVLLVTFGVMMTTYASLPSTLVCAVALNHTYTHMACRSLNPIWGP
jgi:hypothetical protein